MRGSAIFTPACIDARRLRGLCSSYPDRQPRCGSDSARTHRPVPLHPQVTFPYARTGSDER